MSADKAASLILLPWCIRCGAFIADASTCPRAPDGGTHEAYEGPPFAVRAGHSLHECGCPRACPLPDFDPPCTCTRRDNTDGPVS